jgi:hypothetical protein
MPATKHNPQTVGKLQTFQKQAALQQFPRVRNARERGGLDAFITKNKIKQLAL